MPVFLFEFDREPHLCLCFCLCLLLENSLVFVFLFEFAPSRRLQHQLVGCDDNVVQTFVELRHDVTPANPNRNWRFDHKGQA